MSKGDKLTKKRKLSLALEAYRNAIKKDVENKDAWRKFEKIVVRISEEGGCSFPVVSHLMGFENVKST
jgi:hypothetical protein